MPYVVDEIKRCGIPARPTLRQARRKARKHLPPTANPALTTMHSSTLANDFSFCPTLASASFQPLFSRCSRCLPSKPRVLTLLRTLFLSLHSFRLSPHLFSIACGLFVQNTGGVGVPLRHLRALRASALPFTFFVGPLFSSTYKSLLVAHRFATFSVFTHLQIPFPATSLYSHRYKTTGVWDPNYG